MRDEVAVFAPGGEVAGGGGVKGEGEEEAKNHGGA